MISVNPLSFFWKISLLIRFVRYSEVLAGLMFRHRAYSTTSSSLLFFTWHISFAGNFPGRIHFLPDVAHRIGIVGNIGKNLPASRYSKIMARTFSHLSRLYSQERQAMRIGACLRHGRFRHRLRQGGRGQGAGWQRGSGGSGHGACLRYDDEGGI